MTRDRRQTELEGAGPDLAGYAQHLANKTLRPSRPQEACDVGLFGDGPAQIDLVDYINATARKP